MCNRLLNINRRDFELCEFTGLVFHAVKQNAMDTPILIDPRLAVSFGFSLIVSEKHVCGGFTRIDFLMHSIYRHVATPVSLWVISDPNLTR